MQGTGLVNGRFGGGFMEPALEVEQMTFGIDLGCGWGPHPK